MKNLSARIDELVENRLSASEEAAQTGANPWLSAKRRWNEVFASLASATKFLIQITVISWALSFMLAAGLISVALKPKFIPYVIEVNSAGAVLGAGIPTEKTPDDKSTIRELAEWVTNFRSVASDFKVQRRFVDKVYSYLIQSSPATTMVTDWYGKNDPFERSTEELVSVEVESVLRLSSSSWQIEWKEIPSDISGRELPRVRYRAVINIEKFEIKNAESIPSNPFGIFIKTLAISRIGE